MIANFKLPELSLPSGLSIDRLQRRREMQKLIDRQARLLEYSGEARGFDDYYERAISMLTSDRVRKAFDLSAGESIGPRPLRKNHRTGKAACWPAGWSNRV